jgi:hypothetical protein
MAFCTYREDNKMLPTPVPDLRVLAQDFYERPYGPEECWRPIFELLQAGGFVEVTADPHDAVRAVQQIWWHDDARPLLSVIKPWDWLLMRERGPAVQHPALAVDGHDLIHLHRTAGVRIEPIRRYRDRILQVARLRCFC